MHWLAETLRAHPEIAIFATLAIGYGLARLRLGSLQLNPVIGVLVAGIVVGQLDVAVPATIQWTFFVLFLFAIGYSTGPQFFRGLRVSGLPQAGLAVFLCLVGLATTLLLARLFGFGPGTAAGLLAGGLNASAAIGTAGDAIGRLPGDAAVRQRLATDVTVAFAVSYLAGLLATVWTLSSLGPRLMRVDVAAACRELEAEMGVTGSDLDVASAYRQFVTRAYALPAALGGQPAGELERSFAPERVFVERIRRGTELLDADPATGLQAGDRVVLAGRREVLVGEGNPLRAAEVDDAELLDVPTVQVDVILTRRDLAGHTLGQIADFLDREVATRGVFVHRLARAGQELPRALGTVLERGDVVTLVGGKAHVERVAARVGAAQWASLATDLPIVAAAIAAGGVLGVVSVRVGGFDIGLSLAVGVLLGGLIVGWLRSVTPGFGRVPGAALWVFDSLGLTGFLAVVALNAGPEFVRGLRESGAVLLVSGVLLGAVPHVLTILVGRYLFHLHPGVLLGICAGGGTSPAGLAAVQDAARSKVPTLGYGVSYAVGNVLLALWGSVVVVLLAR
jgi:putative transport protein